MTEQSLSENNKRIAKNTLMLYIRMIVIMLVTLYTSRVVINILGVVDYGIYNIVAGVVVLFSFFNSAMTTASQRFLSLTIGKGNKENIQKVFSASLISHLILSLIIVILAESAGLWFIKTQLTIPDTRTSAAAIIYHIAIVTTCVNILRVPFNALIISYEKMNFYAYISIIEVFLKLIIVWFLSLFSFDKLILYSILLLLVNVAINIAYVVYGIKNCHVTLCLNTDKKLLKEMTSFSGWNVFGAIADVGYKQGTNIILNIFYGVTLNAVMGITNQIRTSVYTFVSNFQVAANPQIIKSYAIKDIERFSLLVCGISKYSYYLMLLIAMPLILNMDFVLELWLRNPPEHSMNFAILILIFCLFDSLTGPLWTSMQASGKIKKYLLIISSSLLLNLPLTYIFLKFGYPPESMLVIQIFVNILTLIIRTFFIRKVNIGFKKYFISVLIPIFLVSITSIQLPYFLGSKMSSGIIKFLCTGFASVVSIVTCIYLFGVSTDERIRIKILLKSKFKK